MATPEPRDEPLPDVVELPGIVEQWGREFELERQLMDMGAAIQVTWVPLAEAERRVGVSRSTLRAWYRTGEIPSRLMPGPHGLQRLVPLEAITARAERSPRTGPRPKPVPKADSTPDSRTRPEEEAVTPGLSTPDAMVRLAELAARAAADRAQAAEARAEAAEAKLHTALERAAAAEAELRVLRAPRSTG